ncbi:hypothetical protein [Myxacorys almedinensis]|uniref:Uncharacterized protein n=1 Tax=Myxacorys almedinensis A TaxID=2690445 RepID=A0A8J8CKH2_9CYAN|nr:hypothetical protein [Myxacorys almedinensis]NDJ19534.1 hypothetical protein [Myxacorys almedinensis A]
MSELDQSFTELSATQEESVAGGCDMAPSLFFQETAIDTFGESQMSVGNQDGLSASSSTRTGYSFRQTTFAIFGGDNFQASSFLRILDLFRRFF